MRQSSSRSGPLLLDRLHRELQRDDRPSLEWTVDDDRTGMSLDQAFGGGQSQAGAAGLGREKRREQPFANLRGNARAVVRDDHAQSPIVELDRDPYRSSPLRGVRAVENQVL